MHKSRLAGFIIDCQTEDLDAAARFWGAALGLQAERRPAAEALYRSWRPPRRPHVEVQQVATRAACTWTSKRTTSRPKRGVSSARRAAHRAVRSWVVMQAPTGQRFCIVRVQRGDFDAHANIWA